MEIPTVDLQLAVVLPLLLLGEAFVVALVWIANGWEAPRPLAVATWVVLSALTMWCGFVVAFVAVHALLFTLGTEAAWIGVLGCVAFLLVTPIAWAMVIRRQSHHPAAHG
jgi:hypothetical protein